MKKDIWYKVIPVGLLLAVLQFLFYIYMQRDTAYLAEEDKTVLSSVSTEFFFCGNVDMERMDTEVFTHNLGHTVFKWNRAIEIRQQLQEVWNSFVDVRSDGYVPSALYLYMDLRCFADGNTEKEYRLAVEELASSHPKMEVRLFLIPPSLSDWVAMQEAESENLLDSYAEWIKTVSSMDKGTVYFMGAEKWLIANPGNYEGASLEEGISKSALAMTFADQKYRVDENTVDDYLDILRQEVKKERDDPIVYPDLSNVDIVFFGDSIIGNYSGPTSIPGVVSALSGARTYNMAEGGTTARGSSDDPHCFGGVVKVFLEKDPAASPAQFPFRENFEAFLQDDHDSRKLVFVLNYGLNDYFSGALVEATGDLFDKTTYAGALRSGIEVLRSAYPDAEIILMTPNFISAFGNGEEILGEAGSALADYAKAARRVATDMSITCLDNYAELGINAENEAVMLGDSVHLNGTGRMIVGERIVYALGR